MYGIEIRDDHVRQHIADLSPIDPPVGRHRNHVVMRRQESPQSGQHPWMVVGDDNAAALKHGASASRSPMVLLRGSKQSVRS
jgi:hypothetical protein